MTPEVQWGHCSIRSSRAQTAQGEEMGSSGLAVCILPPSSQWNWFFVVLFFFFFAMRWFQRAGASTRRWVSSAVCDVTEGRESRLPELLVDFTYRLVTQITLSKTVGKGISRMGPFRCEPFLLICWILADTQRTLCLSRWIQDILLDHEALQDTMCTVCRLSRSLCCTLTHSVPQKKQTILLSFSDALSLPCSLSVAHVQSILTECLNVTSAGRSLWQLPCFQLSIMKYKWKHTVTCTVVYVFWYFT